MTTAWGGTAQRLLRGGGASPRDSGSGWGSPSHPFPAAAVASREHPRTVPPCAEGDQTWLPPHGLQPPISREEPQKGGSGRGPEHAAKPTRGAVSKSSFRGDQDMSQDPARREGLALARAREKHRPWGLFPALCPSSGVIGAGYVGRVCTEARTAPGGHQIPAEVATEESGGWW